MLSSVSDFTHGREKEQNEEDSSRVTPKGCHVIAEDFNWPRARGLLVGGEERVVGVATRIRRSHQRGYGKTAPYGEGGLRTPPTTPSPLVTYSQLESSTHSSLTHTISTFTGFLHTILNLFMCTCICVQNTFTHIIAFFLLRTRAHTHRRRAHAS